MLLGVCQYAGVQFSHVGGLDFNCREISSEAREMLGGLVAGNAAARENSHQRSKKCAPVCLNILLGLGKPGRVPPASKKQL